MEVLPGFIWRLDRDFRFTYVSDQVADVTGMEAESHIGARFDDLDFIWDRNHDPLEKRAAFRSVGGFGPARGGHRIRLVLSGKPVFEANEGFVGFVGSAIVVDLPDPGIGGTSIPDIGPTSPGASLARDRLDMFRNAVECLTDGFALFDPDDKLIFCNTSFRRMNENTPWKFDGETTFEMIIRSNMRLGLLEEAVGREEMFLAERMARHRAPPEEPRLMCWTDGNVLLVRERRLADGATVVVNTDLTELSKRERALADALRSAEQASRAKSAFLARMSHELRTPLNAIIGFSDLVLSETFGPLGSERYYDYVGDVKRSGEHLLSLINDLLDLTGI
jgi:PAS domain-containing protein